MFRRIDISEIRRESQGRGGHTTCNETVKKKKEGESSSRHNPSQSFYFTAVHPLTVDLYRLEEKFSPSIKS